MNPYISTKGEVRVLNTRFEPDGEFSVKPTRYTYKKGSASYLG
jgi:hypothetical protein